MAKERITPMAQDIVIAKMQELNVPMTRQNYLEFAFFGEVPDEIDAEIEAMLPREFQLNPGGEF
jgi:hypothetical protein